MASRRKTTVQVAEKGRKSEILGIFYLFLSAFLFLSLLSFSPGDPSFNQAVSPGTKVQNVVGYAGAYCAGLLVEFFGLGALCWPVWFLYLGLKRFVKRIRLSRIKWLGIIGLFIAFEAWAMHPWFSNVPDGAYGLVGSGFLGREIITRYTMPYLRPMGTFLLWAFVTIVSLQALIGFSWASVWMVVMRAMGASLAWAGLQRQRMAERRETRARRREEEQEQGKLDLEFVELEDAAPARPKKLKPVKKEPTPQPIVEENPEPVRAPKPKPAPAPEPVRTAPVAAGDLPSTDLLAPVPPQHTSQTAEVLQPLADKLSECLNDFNVQGEIQQVIPGPVVTMFEFKPAPGIKVSKIENLTDDIALALRAESVRIEAPIPGKDSVGIEIPNIDREMVYLREILESEVFNKSKSPLTLALGKDIHGATQVADLAKMPHLLVAGATGAGKSVGINCFLLSLLYKCGPDKVKLLLVDPKRIELAPYAELPHLVHPVVTDMNMAKSALEWAVFEMDCRYEKMAQLGVRNIEGYNKKVESFGGNPPEGMEHMTHMPYLVIIIDELADLMMTAAKEVEQYIVRLAQLARAAGIHMILATQRPSVDVVTGLIKANFPTRISFFVTSKFDSRTILDSVGAERLLGKGDMLFKPSGGKLKRMHGAYMDETEIAQVVNFWKEAVPQQFELDFNDWKQDSGNGGGTAGGAGQSDDPVYDEAVEFVLQQGKASISLLQRRLRIGFNRAARYIEQMEMDGLLGPQEGSKPRQVIKPE